MLRQTLFYTYLSVAILGSIACSASPPASSSGSGGNTSSSSSGMGGEASGVGGDFNPAGTGGGGGTTNPPPKIEETLPDGFTAETGFGGWRVVGPLADFNEPAKNV